MTALLQLGLKGTVKLTRDNIASIVFW